MLAAKTYSSDVLRADMLSVFGTRPFTAIQAAWAMNCQQNNAVIVLGRLRKAGRVGVVKGYKGFWEVKHEVQSVQSRSQQRDLVSRMPADHTRTKKTPGLG